MKKHIRVTKLENGYRIDLVEGTTPRKLASVPGRDSAKRAMARARAFQAEVGDVDIVWDASRRS